MAIDRTPLGSGGKRSGRASSRAPRRSVKRRYIPRLEALEDRAMPALPGFSIVDVFVAEGNSGTTAAQFRILLDQAAAGVVTVDYSTADGGSAAPGIDFTATSGVATFAPGETVQLITVPILGDTDSEGSENFVVNLSNPSAGAIIVDNMAVGTIADEEYATTAAASPLDQDFGTNGTVSEGSFVMGVDIAVDGNDRPVVLGGLFGNSQVVRYNPNGTLDTTFGGTGVVNISGPVTPGGVAAYPQGAFRDYVVVGGTLLGSPNSDIHVQRLNPDGTPDTTADSTPDTAFGANGFVTLDLGGDESVHDVEVKASGEVVVAGTSSNVVGTRGFVVVFNADGTVQSTTFFPAPSGDVLEIGDIAIDPAGNIVVAGTYLDAGGVSHGFTTRILAGGGIDASYGVRTVPNLDAAAGVAVSASGQIVVSGDISEQATLVGLTPDGALDSAFGTNGVVIEPTFTGYSDVDFDNFGNLVVTGSGNFPDPGQVIGRYSANGTPDTTFNTDSGNAFIVIDNPSIPEEGAKVAVAGNGQIYAVGTEGNGSLLSMTTTSVSSDRADVSVAAAPSASNILVGQTVTVTYTVTNNGPQPTGEVTATADVFSQNVVSSTAPFTQNGSTYTWQFGTLAPGQSVTFDVVYQPTSTGLAAPALFVYGNVPDPDASNNFGAPHIPVGDITLTPAAINENEPPGTSAGVLDSREEESLPMTLSVVPGAGDDLFTIDASGNLVSLVSFDFEATQTVTVGIQGVSSSGDIYTKTFVITVNDVNDLPVANNDVVTTVEGNPVAITNAFLVSNDTDQDAGASLFVIEITSFPANGTLSPVAGGNVYQPNPGFTGTDTFTYLVADGMGGSASATVTINVVPFNDPPVGTDDVLIGAFEDSGPFVIPFSALLGNDSPGPEESGQGITIVGVNSAVGGTVEIVGTNVVFTPSPNFNGSASFKYVLADDGGAVAVVDPLVSFQVRPINDPPAGGPDVIANIPEDSGPSVIPFSQLLGNDSAGAADESGETLTIVGINSAVGGVAVIVGQTIVFTPFPDYNGPAGFTYIVQDNGASAGVFDPRTTAVPVAFTVTEVNDPPTAINLVLPTVFNFATFPFSSFAAGATVGPSNEAGQSLSVSGVSNVVGGTATVTSSGVVFVPTTGFSGVASFTFTLSDNGTTAGVSDPQTTTATVRFTVGSSLPSAAGAVGGNSTTTLIVPGIARSVDSVVTNSTQTGDSGAYVAQDAIRILVPPTQGNPATTTWGSVDSRISTIVPLFQNRIDSRPAGPTTVSPGELTGSPEAPRRGRLMQIVNSQFDGEDNVNIIEQLLTPPAPPANDTPPPNPGGAARLPALGDPANPRADQLDADAVAAVLAIPQPAEAPPAAHEPETTWRQRLASFGMGLLLVAGFFGNLALAPVAGQRLFAEPKRKKRGPAGEP